MRAGGHRFLPWKAGLRTASRWWIRRTAIEPSPTAEATRLIEPEWTSPTAKIPGGSARLVAVELGEVLALQVTSGQEEPGVIRRQLIFEPLGGSRPSVTCARRWRRTGRPR